MGDFDALQDQMRQFVAEREWGQFHDPKSLLLALTGEVGELCELFQWLPAPQAAETARRPPLADAVNDELADVLLYLVALADTLDVDLVSVAAAKLRRNQARFPVDTFRAVAPKRRG